MPQWRRIPLARRWAIGRVAWTKRVTTPRPDGAECGIGVEFLGGASDQFLALQGYIESMDDEVIDGDEAFEDA